MRLLLHPSTPSFHSPSSSTPDDFQPDNQPCDCRRRPPHLNRIYQLPDTWFPLERRHLEARLLEQGYWDGDRCAPGDLSARGPSVAIEPRCPRSASTRNIPAVAVEHSAPPTVACVQEPAFTVLCRLCPLEVTTSLAYVPDVSLDFILCPCAGLCVPGVASHALWASA